MHIFFSIILTKPIDFYILCDIINYVGNCRKFYIIT